MSILRNKIFIGVLCIVVGLAVGFVLLPKSQSADVQMTQIVRLKQDTAAGVQLTAEMLEEVAVPSADVPDGASSKSESFLSRYTSSQLYAGDILTSAKVRDTLADPVAAAAAKGKQLVSVSVPSLSSGVSGTLLPGDVVSIMVTRLVTVTENEFEESQWTGGLISSTSTRQEKQTYIPDELRYMEVCRVTSSDGTVAMVNDERDADEPNRLPVTITFYASEMQAIKLAEIEQEGKLHIVFVARGDAADDFIPRAERVLAEERAAESGNAPEQQGAEIPSQPVNSEVPADITVVIPDDVQAAQVPQPTQTDAAGSPIDYNNPEVGE